MPDCQAGMVTFLFTDIESSTRLWEQDPAGMRVAQARHNELVGRAVEQHGGRVFKTIGDGCCAAFSAAPDALLAALAAQRALREEAWSTPRPLHVRMALHTGTADLIQGDYQGPALSRADRIVDAGHGGQILLSRSAAEAVRPSLPPDLALRDLGERYLRGLGDPEQIFQVVSPGLPSNFPPLRTLDFRTANLPSPPTSFIGREREVAEVCALLRSPGVRLVTLTGPGGTGKTRLCIQVGEVLLDEFEAGVCFVPLASITDLHLVAASVAQALQVREAPGRPLLETLKEYLTDRQLLLVLDNFEHVVEAAPLVTELLAAAASLKVLVTSRELLNVYGEHEFAVPPLSLPDLTHLPAPEALLSYEAVALFAARSRAVRRDFALTEANAPSVAEICTRLDGLPLAIELAAAQLRRFPLPELAARLGDRLGTLTGGPRDVPARQRTLRGTIAWSYDLLSEAEQELFCRLSVFSGGWASEAAEVVCSGDEIKQQDVQELLPRLVEKSLVVAEESALGALRYRLYETIREYAEERLGEENGGDLVRSRHRDWFLRIAEEAEQQLQGPEQGAWIQRLEVEHDNLRAAVDWCFQRREAEEGLRLVGALAEFWHARGYLTEGRERLAQLLSIPEEPNALHQAQLSRGARAKALYRIGMLSTVAGDTRAAQPLLRQSLTIARELNIRPMIAWALNWLATEDCLQGNYGSARPTLVESLSIFRELNDARGISYALDWLGHTASFQGDYAAGHAFLEEALDVGRRLGDRHSVAWTLVFQGVLVYQEGLLGEAREALEEALATSRELGIRPVIAWSLIWLAYVLLSEGDPAGALSRCAEGLTLARELSIRLGTAYLLNALGQAHMALGDDRAARSWCIESLLIASEIGAQVNIADCLESLAGLNGAEAAAHLLGAAAALREATGVPVPLCSRAGHDLMVSAVRSATGHDAFQQAWADGVRTPLQETIAFAIETARSA